MDKYYNHSPYYYDLERDIPGQKKADEFALQTGLKTLFSIPDFLNLHDLVTVILVWLFYIKFCMTKILSGFTSNTIGIKHNRWEAAHSFFSITQNNRNEYSKEIDIIHLFFLIL